MKKQTNALLPLKMRVGERMINGYGRIETIYGIEREGNEKYVSTIATDDERFVILKTYFVKGKETIIEVSEKKENFLENLEKTTLNHIEKEMGFDALASQFN